MTGCVSGRNRETDEQCGQSGKFSYILSRSFPRNMKLNLASRERNITISTGKSGVDFRSLLREVGNVANGGPFLLANLKFLPTFRQ